MTLLSQRDPSWSSVKLGFGSGTIGDYGCTITCLAMLLGLTPAEVNQKMKDNNSFGGTTQNLVVWAQLPKSIPQIKSATRFTLYDNDAVKKAIEDNGGCLVEVDFDSKISSPNDRHWVLYIGNGRMYDPWTGVEKATSWYPITKGYAVIETQTVQNGESGELAACMSDRLKFWAERDQSRAEAESLRHDLEAKSTEAKEIRKELNTFMESLASKLITIVDKAEIIGAVERMLSQETELQKKVSEVQKAYDKLEEDKKAEIAELKKELQSVKNANTHMADQIDRLEDRIVELEVPPTPQKSLIDIIKGLLEAWKGKHGK